MSLLSIASEDGAARTGVITLPRGEVRTPAFMPIGTAGSVKAMMPQSVAATGADIILGNTYHLMLRPGAERVARLGGLHKFMNWEKPILTDSGGFQVMSLAKLRKLDEDGVTFRSHVDGSEFFLSPERAMEIQRLLGSDIQMVLDECPSYPATRADIETSLALTTRWAKRSKAAFSGVACFGIVQGGVFADLRARSAAELIEIGFDGYALGGLAVGESQGAMFETLDAAVPLLPEDKPRYLMGVGKPDDIAGAVLRGIDMFDCVIPTRSGRNAQAYHARWHAQPAQRAPCRGRGAARRALRLSCLHALQPRLSAPRGQGERDHRVDAHHLAQPRLLPGPDGRPAHRHRAGPPGRRGGRDHAGLRAPRRARTG